MSNPKNVNFLKVFPNFWSKVYIANNSFILIIELNFFILL